MIRTVWMILMCAAAIAATATPARAGQDAAFGYQGQLKRDGRPVSALVDMEFRLFDAGFLVVVVAATSAAIGEVPDPKVERYTVDSGGVMRSEAGELELSGTMGQPDAGVLTIHDLELVGGFWLELKPTDCNDDGVVGLADVAALRACLAGPAEIVATDCHCFDIVEDGVVDLRDFADAQRVFDGD